MVISLILKYDTNFNLKWEWSFFKDNKYIIVNNIKETFDGGCIIAGNFKGSKLISWTKNIKLPKTKINIFPNPAANHINIELKNSIAKIANIRITDSRGKLIKSIIVDSKSIKIDIQNFISGIYFVNGENNKGESFFGKFVKE